MTPAAHDEPSDAIDPADAIDRSTALDHGAAFDQGTASDHGAAFDHVDALDAEVLRARGSLKWTAFPGEIAAWVAESDFGTAPAVTAALHRATDAGTFGYLPPAVRTELAEACARWHGDRYGWDVAPSRVKPVADVLDALRITVEHFSRPGSAVIVPTPAYMPFVTVPRQWGRDVIEVPVVADGGRTTFDLDALADAMRSGGHLLLLTNPHNPTGRVYTRSELTALAEVVERNGARVFSDEIHAPLVYPGGEHVPYASVSEAAAQHTVTATSASKAWNIPGLKCAQIVLSNEADDERWAPIDLLATHGASTLGVVANTAAYRDGGPWLEELIAHLDGNRRALAEVLAELAPQIGYVPPEGSYLAWLDLRAALAAIPGAPRDHLARWLGECTGVVVTDGAACGRAGRGFVRLNLAMPRPMVVEAGRRIAALLDHTT